MSENLTVSQLTSATRRRLIPLYGSGEADAMLRVIWEHLRGWQPVDIVLHGNDEVGTSVKQDFESIMARLEKHEPLQYILGKARFYGLMFNVNRDTLIPRPETEGLVQLIVDDWGSTPDLRVADIGTGSGAIAIALARYLPFSHVTAFDISTGALKVARENASNLHAEVRFVEGDILTSDLLCGDYDIIVSNPPYVLDIERQEMDSNVLDYEPQSAIFALANNPEIFYRVIAKSAARVLVKGGKLYFELNPQTADSVRRMVESEGFEDVELLRDIHGRMRYLKAMKPRR